MRETTFPCDEAISDPQPRFASAEEIALAERLRHQIEEHYLRGNQGGRGSDDVQPFRKAA